jgi:AraC-like DNA-binding protein
VLVGLRFRPGAAPPWLGVPASDIVNGRLALQQFWGADARRLADRLGDARTPSAAAAMMLSALRARRQRTSLVDPAAPAILAALHRADEAPPRLPALAESLDLSERTLRRRCESAFGYGPKTLERILRFQRFLRLLRRSLDPHLAELAATSGYADQAHLTREVRSLGGLTPRRLQSELAA